jgi:pyruvate dehydrogenase E2 component (dihydrolipoamide acetyltransferase)
MTDVTMPQLGETVTEGTITRWAKQVGDYVDADEVLFEVSTDKVDSEVPASTAGYITEILVPEGETVDVGTRLAVISESPPDGKDAEAKPGSRAGAEQPSPAPAAGAAKKSPAPAAESPAPAPAAESPAPAAESPAPAPAKPKLAATARSAPGGEQGAVLSPVVRRLINENGLDPSTITGTGAGGRITRDDVLAVLDAQRSGQASGVPLAPRPAGGAARAAGGPGAVPAPAAPRAGAGAPEREESIPFSKIRRITAEHMVRSKATSAHTGVVAEVDYSAVERARAAHKEAFRASEGISLTYLPFVARAVIDALEEFPHMNSSVGNDELIVHHYVNLGIAVDLNFEGLLVPVVKDADTKRLRALAREIADLASRARSKRLSVDELAGGTFTITNAGPFGTFLTIPVINQPQVAIMSTDGVKKRPVAVTLPDGSDAVAVHPVGLLGLSFDHRAVDGAYASAFMARVKDVLETRDWDQEF